MELSWLIESITELDYDGISATVKQITPLFDGEKSARTYIRATTETDVDAKTAIKTDLTDKKYVWTSEI